MNKKKAFKNFIEKDLLVTYSKFCLGQVMHKEIDDKDEYKYYSQFLPTWNILLHSLGESYLLGLARLFDRYNFKGKEEVISVYSFLDHDFVKHDRTIRAIKVFRDNVLAHSNWNFMDNPRPLEEAGLSYGDIESLFSTTAEVLERIKNNFGYNQDLRERFAKEKEEAKKEFMKWYVVFQRGFESS